MRRLVIVLVVLTACRGGVDGVPQVDEASVPAPARVRPIVPPPHAVHGHRLHDLGDALLLFGGERSGTGALSGTAAWRLDDGASEWRRVGDLAAAHSFGRSAVLRGVVFAMGGSFERFDPVGGTWSSAGPDEVFPRSHAASTVHEGRLHTLGGFPKERAGLRAFDVARGTWERLPDPPGFAAGDHFHFLASLRGRLHLFGGLGGSRGQPQDLHFVFDGVSWSEATPAPHDLWAKFSASTVHEARFYVFDAAHGLVYDAGADTWTRLPPLPRRLAMPAAIVRDGCIVVLGGMDVDVRPFPRVALSFDIDRRVWTDLTPLRD